MLSLTIFEVDRDYLGKNVLVEFCHKETWETHIVRLWEWETLGETKFFFRETLQTYHVTLFWVQNLKI